MPKTLLEELAERIDPVEVALFDLADLVAERVAELLGERKWTQRELARRLGKKESYVSRLLAGGQNPTLRTLAELQTVFGEPIVTTPAQVLRDHEDAYAEIRSTLDTLSLSVAGAGDALPAYKPNRADVPWLTVHQATADALGTSSPERFVYPARC